ncbi:MAG: hypothetical protein GIW95_08085 [Candidatus Eremiobacteraeota bacterium]|nr:hypothetical protein [Candidatus Eremiobacteraeota bacterium]
MTIDWGAVTAISTVLTAFIIGGTAVFAMRQLQELQRSQSFQGTERLLEIWDSPEIRAARAYVLEEFPKRLDDPAYRVGLLRDGIRAELSEHPELLLLRYYERVGSCVYHRLLLGAAIYEQIAVTLVRTWPTLKVVAETMRRAEDNPYMFDKAELLHEEALRQASKQFAALRRLRPSTGSIFTAEDMLSPNRPEANRR